MQIERQLEEILDLRIKINPSWDLKQYEVQSLQRLRQAQLDVDASVVSQRQVLVAQGKENSELRKEIVECQRSLEDWREQAEKWQVHAVELQAQLEEARQQLEISQCQGVAGVTRQQAYAQPCSTFTAAGTASQSSMDDSHESWELSQQNMGMEAADYGDISNIKAHA